MRSSLVLLLAREAVLGGDGLGGQAHRHEAVLSILARALLDKGRDVDGDSARL
jgi:hypothetical protein